MTLDLHPLSRSTFANILQAGLDPDDVVRVVTVALGEDLGDGIDVTSAATVPSDQRSTGTFGARRAGVVAGLPAVAAVFDLVCGDESSALVVHAPDGSAVSPGDVIATVRAPTRLLLTAERTALNLLCHLSGVATLTRRWADALDGTDAVVRDTRKTIPGLRALQKYAVRCGGGSNHRMGLYDMALVKDNHVVAAGGVEAAIENLRRLDPGIPVEVEVDSIDDLRRAIDAGVDEILIDNFTPDQMRQAVAVRDGMNPAVRIEASGGLTLENARVVGETGVDFIAVGELTHSARVLDIGLDLTAAEADPPAEV